MSFHVIHSNNIEVEKLDEAILVGWFAHELGHLIDYLPLSNFRMIIFGIKYYFKSSFKKEAESQADEHALERGFGHELIKMKKFILEHKDVKEIYKESFKKYYLAPDVIEVKMKKE